MSVSELAYPQVRYGRPALRTVVCALRFNPILKIGQELPADFQDAVRASYPKFDKQESVELQVAFGEGPPIPALRQGPGSWRFQAEDEQWTAALNVETISLETTSYQTFPDFEQRLSVLYEALRGVYQVDHFTRVGLRYINIFSRDQFPGRWVGRFNPALLGPMADEILGEEVLDSKQLFVVAGDDWTINIRHGTEANNYRLDIDHATEAPVKVAKVAERLRAFNDRAYQIFRWAVAEKLHEEMEPGPHD